MRFSWEFNCHSWVSRKISGFCRLFVPLLGQFCIIVHRSSKLLFVPGVPYVSGGIVWNPPVLVFLFLTNVFWSTRTKFGGRAGKVGCRVVSCAVRSACRLISPDRGSRFKRGARNLDLSEGGLTFHVQGRVSRPSLAALYLCMPLVPAVVCVCLLASTALLVQ